jgi:hypothetical protein
MLFEYKDSFANKKEVSLGTQVAHLFNLILMDLGLTMYGTSNCSGEKGKFYTSTIKIIVA